MERGTSLVEVTMVIALVLVVGAMAVIQLQPLYTEEQANSAMDQVASQLAAARDMAIAQRRQIQVQFVTPNAIQLTRIEYNGTTTLLSKVPLQGTVQYLVFQSLPDTPDGFGNANAIYFEGIAGGPPMMLFQSDGTFIDNAGNLVNGTAFLGVPGNVATARAVTVLGATGRFRSYRAPSGQWIQ